MPTVSIGVPADEPREDLPRPEVDVAAACSGGDPCAATPTPIRQSRPEAEPDPGTALAATGEVLSAVPVGDPATDDREDQLCPETDATAVGGGGDICAATPDVVADGATPVHRSRPDAGLDAGTAPAARSPRSKPAKHRDRRGFRRAQPQPGSGSAVPSTLRPPAKVRLRLILDPIRRTVTLAAVLTRPVGYPDRITLFLGDRSEIVATYSEDRYDDVDLEWTPVLLATEVRLKCQEGYQWLRSSRRVHVFSEFPDETWLVSVPSASRASSSAIVCRQEDATNVRSAAAACGSPELISHDCWAGVPQGWLVLSGYCPSHAASFALDPNFTVLDPGNSAVIHFAGGLPVRAGSFTQGCPPRIEIDPFPTGSRVTIDGRIAAMEDGAWRAHGWDSPGEHLVDVVPGPSRTYRILGDPWLDGGWDCWDAHPGRFPEGNEAPWARAEICGASVLGPSGTHVVAAEGNVTAIALGLRRGVARLWPRPSAPVAVGLLRESPAFLVYSSGSRRSQGHVDWLAPPSSPAQPTQALDTQWATVVRSAASRRLELRDTSATAQGIWRKARARARGSRRVRT